MSIEYKIIASRPPQPHTEAELMRQSGEGQLPSRIAHGVGVLQLAEGGNTQVMEATVDGTTQRGRKDATFPALVARAPHDSLANGFRPTLASVDHEVLVNAQREAGTLFVRANVISPVASRDNDQPGERADHAGGGIGHDPKAPSTQQGGAGDGRKPPGERPPGNPEEPERPEWHLPTRDELFSSGQSGATSRLLADAIKTVIDNGTLPDKTLLPATTQAGNYGYSPKVLKTAYGILVADRYAFARKGGHLGGTFVHKLDQNSRQTDPPSKEAAVKAGKPPHWELPYISDEQLSGKTGEIAEMVADEIKRAIDRGELKHRDPLPSADQARGRGYSKSTLLRAYRILKIKGVASSEANRHGTFVNRDQNSQQAGQERRTDPRSRSGAATEQADRKPRWQLPLRSQLKPLGETRNLKELLAAHIRRDIETGVLSPEDRLPSIKTQRARGYIPQTVNGAYKILQEQGLVVSSPLGTYIDHVPENAAKDISTRLARNHMLAEQFAGAMTKAIQEGVLPPGTILPRIAEQARQHHLPKKVILEARRILRNDGSLVRNGPSLRVAGAKDEPMPLPLKPRGQIEKAMVDIVRQIESGELQPGAELPRKIDHAAQYDMSTASMERARARLTYLGYLISNGSRRPPIVAPPEQWGKPAKAEPTDTEQAKPQRDNLALPPAGTSPDEDFPDDETGPGTAGPRPTGPKGSPPQGGGHPGALDIPPAETPATHTTPMPSNSPSSEEGPDQASVRGIQPTDPAPGEARDELEEVHAQPGEPSPAVSTTRQDERDELAPEAESVGERAETAAAAPAAPDADAEVVVEERDRQATPEEAKHEQPGEQQVGTPEGRTSHQDEVAAQVEVYPHGGQQVEPAAAPNQEAPGTQAEEEPAKEEEFSFRKTPRPDRISKLTLETATKAHAESITTHVEPDDTDTGITLQPRLDSLE